MAPSRAVPHLNKAFGLTRVVSHPARSFAIHPTSRSPGSSQAFRPATARTFFSTSAARNDVEAPDHLDENELKIFEKLRAELLPTSLEVQDISGGCGSMYGLDIVSPKFSGLSVIKQHKLVNQVLADDIKGWHGVQLKTRAP